MFYRKLGKLGATTADVWAGILVRRGIPDPAQAVAAMIADGILVLAPE